MKERELEETTTISPNFLHASTNFDDFQHVSISSLLITFICWKEHKFDYVYNPVTLALNFFITLKYA